MTITDDIGRYVPGGPSQPTHITNAFLPPLPGAVSLSGDHSDAAGRLIVAPPTMIFDTTSEYDASPLIWQTLSSGAGNGAAFNPQERSNILTLAASGYVVQQTYRYTPYQPWRSQEVVLTGTFGAAVAGVTKRIGYFDAKNGLFWEQAGDGTISVVRRTSVSGAVVDNRTPQASWNVNTVPGLSSLNSQVFIIRFLYLGVAIVQWSLFLDGALVVVHEEPLSNTQPTVYMQYASLPLRYEISSSGHTGVATLVRICGAVNSSGGFTQQPGYSFAISRDTPLSAASEVPIVALRPALLFNGIVNRAIISIASISILAASNPIRWGLRYYPPGTSDPVTGGSWVQGTNSATMYNISGTALSLVGSYLVESEFIAASAGGSNRGSGAADIGLRFPLSLDASGANSPLTSAVGGNPAYIVLTALQIGGAATAAGSINWTEVR